MPAPPKTGPITRAEFQALWEGTNDRAWWEPIEQAGDGQGLEAFGQLFAQLARSSAAVDATTQALYILPWSGQSGPPAAGARNAEVTLTFARAPTVLSSVPILLSAGAVLVEESAKDSSELGPVQVLTGRRYALEATRVVAPGTSGPVSVPADAERSGSGYNNPLPGTITSIVQPGAGFSNIDASVVVTLATAPEDAALLRVVQQLVALNAADAPIPEHVGQYFRFTAGANLGVVAHASAYRSPAGGDGGAVSLDIVFSFRAFSGSTVGTFTVGETVRLTPPLITSTLARGVLVDATQYPNGDFAYTVVVSSILGGVLAPASVSFLAGDASGATTSVDQVVHYSGLAAETGTAAWQVLDWGADLSVTATNALSPTGGSAPMLDALGEDRAVARHPGEPDSAYRLRVAAVADVVTPNAVKRAVVRVLGALPFCFREVGLSKLPGFYYDANDAYDDSALVFSGAVVVGFADGDFLEWRDASSNVKARGFFGGMLSGTEAVFIPRSDRPNTQAVAAGDTLVAVAGEGGGSGGSFTIGALVATPALDARRWHTELDYAEFRAFFLIGVPRLALGEFGFAYDAGAGDAYDAGVAWDGFPAGADALYKQVYDAVNAVKAGGVGFDLYVEDGACV